MAPLPSSDSACSFHGGEAHWALGKEIRLVFGVDPHQSVPLSLTDTVHLTSYLAIIAFHIVLFCESYSSSDELEDANTLTRYRFTRSWL